MSSTNRLFPCTLVHCVGNLYAKAAVAAGSAKDAIGDKLGVAAGAAGAAAAAVGDAIGAINMDDVADAAEQVRSTNTLGVYA